MCVRSENCWDAALDQESGTASAWILVFVLFTVGIFCLVIAELGSRYESVYNPIIWLKTSMRTMASPTKTHDELQKEMDMSRAFVNTVRTEENFIRNNADPHIVFPSPYISEYEPKLQDSIILPVTGFLRTGSQWFSASRFSILLGSIGWAFVCSAVSTVFYLAVEYEKKCSNFLEDEEAIQNWVSSVGESCQWILSDYRFFPIFLIVGYISFVVQRWREWMVNCHSIQGRLNDIAMLIGGCVGPNPDKVVRKKLFKIYRYLNVIHALCYIHASPSLADLDLETDFVHKLGLLTADEAYALLAIEVKQRENVLSWLTAEVILLLQMESVNGDHVGLELINSIRGLRGTCATHHGMLGCEVHFGFIDFYLYNKLTCKSSTYRPFCPRQFQHVLIPDDACCQPDALPGDSFLSICSDGSNSTLFSFHTWRSAVGGNWSWGANVCTSLRICIISTITESLQLDH